MIDKEGMELLGLEHPAMVRRLANLLVARRLATGERRVFLARSTHGRWSRQNLIDIEAGRVHLEPAAMVEVAHLYGADLSVILPRRLPLLVDVDSLQTGGVTTFYRPGDRQSLLTGYLSLIRQLRQNPISPTIELRRDDIEAIAAFVAEPPARVVDDLAVLLGANQRQRKALAALLTTGVGVVTLSALSISAAHLAAGRGEEAAAMPFKRSHDLRPDGDSSLADTERIDTGPGVDRVDGGGDQEPTDPGVGGAEVGSPMIVMNHPTISITVRADDGDISRRRTPDAGFVAASRPAWVFAPPSPVPEPWTDAELIRAANAAVKAPVGDASSPTDTDGDDSVWSIDSFDEPTLWAPPQAADRVEVGAPPIPV